MRTLILILLALPSFCQVEIKLQLQDSLKAPQDLYLAGDFNGWKAGDEKYRFEGLRLVIDSLPNFIEFKVVGKSWAQVEGSKEGKAIANRKRIIRNNTTFSLSIAGWEKTQEAIPLAENIITHSAEEELHYKGHSKTVWVYLPATYSESSDKLYPILYLMDGQNLFIGTDGSALKWEIGKTLDSLLLDLIVVGIEHGGTERINELSPYPNAKYGGGEADSLLNFIQYQLKPFLHKRYRISQKREHNLIGGSSLGGLFSLYALLKAENEFGAGLIFSPSYWFNPELENFASRQSRKSPTFIYQLMGGQEGSDPLVNIALVQNMEVILAGPPKAWKCKTKIVGQGRHTEKFWQEEFAEAILWLSEQMTSIKTE